MKVLHINCNYAGTALHRNMITQLNALEIESCVYVPVYDAKGVSVDTPGARVILSECFRKRDRYIFDYKQHKIITDLKSKIDVKEFDCIHAYTLFTDGNTARELSREHKIPYVVAVRSTDVHAFFRKAVYLRRRGVAILRDAAKVFFLSESYRKLVLEKYVPAKYRQEIYDKSCIMPNGIDDFWLEHLYSAKKEHEKEIMKRLAAKELRVVYAGTIMKRKNPVATQEALQILRKKGWKVSFTAVGRVKDNDVKEQMCAYPDTTYVEQKTKEELIDYYRESDLFVMPSYAETFGLVYSEAMSQGLPVLYTKGQGFDGQFPDGMIGYAIEPDKPEDIAEKIELAVSRYEALTEQVLINAERFRWSDICRQYASIYIMLKNLH